LRARRIDRSAAVAAFGKRLAAITFVAVTLVAAGCENDPQVLPSDTFRNVVPANAELVDEVEDDGSSLTIDGERTVLRTFAPTPPAAASDVLEELVVEGEIDGWLFAETSPSLAVGTKEIDGRPWMASVSVTGTTVQLLFAGR
jgi:hypothetical protein